MLFATRWVLGLRHLKCARYSTAAIHKASSHPFIEEIEMEAARVLRAVRARVDERATLLAQLSENSANAQDVQNARYVKELEPLQDAWDKWTKARELLQQTALLLNDPDPSMRSLALQEYETLTSSMSHHIRTVIPALLIPPSPTAHLSSLIEIRSGVGGSESSLFVAHLLRMYLRFANEMGWKTQLLSKNELDGGGMKDAIVEVKGRGSYDDLRWETGIHRVQRVPATEASGRVHTSTVAVLVMPLSEEDSESDNELFSMDDIKLEVMRARGAGGQHVNTTESAVRLTHVPTGITVSMQDERSQHQNKRRAFQVLTARLMDLKIRKDIEERRSARRKLVSTSDRSEKIRTYNYVQDRVTDHRIALTLKNLSLVMEGKGLVAFIDSLKRDYNESLLEEVVGD